MVLGAFFIQIIYIVCLPLSDQIVAGIIYLQACLRKYLGANKNTRIYNPNIFYISYLNNFNIYPPLSIR